MEMPNSPFLDHLKLTADTRRHFLGWGTGGLGALFLNAAMAQSNTSKNAATATLRAKGPARHLSAHGRLTQPA
jgi:hypothetical protein